MSRSFATYPDFAVQIQDPAVNGRIGISVAIVSFSRESQRRNGVVVIILDCVAHALSFTATNSVSLQCNHLHL